MQGLFRNVTALEVRDDELAGGGRWRYIVLYDDERRENVTMTLDRDCEPPAIEFGTKVNVWAALRSGDKVVRGEQDGRPNDRSFSQLKLRAVSVELADRGSVDRHGQIAAVEAVAS